MRCAMRRARAPRRRRARQAPRKSKRDGVFYASLRDQPSNPSSRASASKFESDVRGWLLGATWSLSGDALSQLGINMDQIDPVELLRGTPLCIPDGRARYLKTRVLRLAETRRRPARRIRTGTRQMCARRRMRDWSASQICAVTHEPAHRVSHHVSSQSAKVMASRDRAIVIPLRPLATGRARQARRSSMAQTSASWLPFPWPVPLVPRRGGLELASPGGGFDASFPSIRG